MNILSARFTRLGPLLFALVLLTEGCGHRPPRPSQYELETFFRVNALKFQRIDTLVTGDPRLSLLSQQPKSQEAVLAAGASESEISEYLQLLRDLKANELIYRIENIGRASVVVYDEGGGIEGPVEILGFVLDPGDITLVKNLDRYDPDHGPNTATVAFAPLDGHWFMFRLR
jgi:hypothetical protein